MAHTINYNPEIQLIEIKVEGSVDFHEMKEIFAQAVRIAIEKDTFLFLSDFRDAIIHLSVSEIYDLPQTLSNTTLPMGVNANLLKRAIVYSPKTFGDSHFAENVAANQGQIAQFFQDVDEAIQWLSEK